MTVFVVTGQYYGDDYTSILGVFSSYEKAAAKVEYCKRNIPNLGLFDIDDYKIDEESYKRKELKEMKNIMVFFEVCQTMEVEESLLENDTSDLIAEVAQSLGVNCEDITYICADIRGEDCCFYERDEVE